MRQRTGPWWRRGFELSGFQLITLLAAAAVGLVLLGLAVELYRNSQDARAAFGWGFLRSRAWDPVAGEFGALPFIYGTVVSSLLALLLATPLGILTGIYLAELAPPRWRALLSFLVELLAAVPSVVYGLWGLYVMVPWLQERIQPWLGEHLGFLPLFEGAPYGISMMAGALVLAIMIVPTISAISRDVIGAVPRSQREAFLALGATPMETIFRVVLPFARSGIAGAVILALGRALGETMAVTMVIGNAPEISTSLLAPAATMASVIANEFAEATTELHRAALMEIGVLLLVISLLVNILARLLLRRLQVVEGAR
ncbi:phosphate ABC transporter permease subunit PstC [Thermaerobacter sp. PB12/4term]|uniref:phosphate ABC transporter permease subunit PstC n=1 Tax=Thermaerobacter sp. PB12/4term TaxID=2293838 RepID=UPI000E327DEE|nr:phosphate ABC transporter permease subunit PstC [Thermaerobacter sp. PB12/4term]QIA27498.1 phosphate ABC transporter permease subunit PstC [Thermaerobacter sp. PB12/4term]